MKTTLAAHMSSNHQPAQPSTWPLPAAGERSVVPDAMLADMASHPLCAGCMPHAVGFYPAALGHRMARSQPEDELLIYCVEGSGYAKAGGQEWQVRAGDLLLLPAGVAHRYEADAADPWSIYWVHLGGRDVVAYFAEMVGEGASVVAPACVPLGVHARLAEEFQALLAALSRPQLSHGVYAANVLRSLLAFAALVRQQRGHQQATLDIEVVNGFLRTHLTQRLGLDDLIAATSTLSRYHFVREYKRQTGLSPMQAFLRMKVSHACYLLDITDEPVVHIASRLGYDDPYYFSRLFKRVMGVSPRGYRRAQEGE